MFIRRALKLSSSLKNVPLTSQNAFAYHLSHVEKFKGTGDTQEYAEDNKNKLKSDLSQGSISKVLITLQNNKDVIKGSDITTAMSTFYHVMRKETSSIIGDHKELERIKWEEHSFSKEMYEIVKSNVNKLSGSEAMQILYYTKKLRGMFETYQVLIEHIRKNLNDLSLDDFRILLSIFKNKSERSKYLRNIEKAMEKKFIMRVSMNHQKDDIDYLVNGLYFISNNSSKVCNKLLDLFIEDLCNYKDNIPVEKLLLIHESLYLLRYFPKKWSELITKTQESIVDNIDAVDSTDIGYIIFIIANQSKETGGMYQILNTTFIDKLLQKFIHEDPGFDSASSILNGLYTMRHYNVEILNYTCASYFEKIKMRNELIMNHNGKFLVVITGLSYANYKSMFWNELETYIMNEKSLLEYDHKTLCIFAMNALCLDCYPIGILEKLFDNTYDFSRNTFLHYTFQKVCQIIGTNHSYEGPRPTELQIQSLNALLEKSIKAKNFFPLFPYLKEGMGGQTYIKTNLCTKLYHLIDHIVAYDKNDHPIPLNSEMDTSIKTEGIDYLEDVKVPQGSKIVAVINTPSSWYFKNTKKLIGTFAVFKNTLEKMNYNVVDIDYSMWRDIPDNEKTSFLKSAIRSKLEKPIITT